MSFYADPQMPPEARAWVNLFERYANECQKLGNPNLIQIRFCPDIGQFQVVHAAPNSDQNLISANTILKGIEELTCAFLENHYTVDTIGIMKSCANQLSRRADVQKDFSFRTQIISQATEPPAPNREMLSTCAAIEAMNYSHKIFDLISSKGFAALETQAMNQGRNNPLIDLAAKVIEDLRAFPDRSPEMKMLLAYQIREEFSRLAPLIEAAKLIGKMLQGSNSIFEDFCRSTFDSLPDAFSEEKEDENPAEKLAKKVGYQGDLGDLDQLHKAYLGWIKENHPDKGGDNDAYIEVFALHKKMQEKFPERFP